MKHSKKNTTSKILVCIISYNTPAMPMVPSGAMHKLAGFSFLAS